MRLVYLGIAWTIGIIIAANPMATAPLTWLLLLALSVGLTISFWQHTRWRWILLSVVALALAGNRYQFIPDSNDLAQYNQLGGATVTGVIVREPDIRDDRIQIRVAAEHIQAGEFEADTNGLLLVNAPRSADLRYGDRVEATGRLNTPGVYDTFSYADYLARQGVFSVMDNTQIAIIEREQGHRFQAVLLDVKNQLQTIINHHLPDPQAALLTGILLGNERGIDPKLAEDFTRVGASHIIAISGFNMTLIAGIIIGTLERIFKRRRWIAIMLGIMVLILYTLLVGANAAVVRAAIMSSVLVIGNLLQRKAYVPASLALVAIVMSAWNPLILWDLSFQLSFFAVLGLALFTEPLTHWFDRLLRLLMPTSVARTIGVLFNEPIVVSVAALIMTLPLIVVNFQRLSLVSLLVNLLIVPVQPALLVLGGLAVIIGLMSPVIAQVLFWLDWLLLSWSIMLVRHFSDLPFAETSVAVAPELVLVFYLSVMGGAILNATRPPIVLNWARWLRQRAVLTIVTAGSIGVFLLMLAIITSRPDGHLHVYWLDVGHSHAVLMTTPNGAQVLIDGGRFPSRLTTSLGDRMPFNDRDIELLFITQPDEFDTSALTSVVNRYNIGTVISNGQPNQNEAYQMILRSLEDVPQVTASAGYQVEFSDGTLIEVLHPSRTPQLGDSNADGALILRVSYGDVSFLISSDLSITGQRDLLMSGEWPLASVMALPQHGTARSLDADFLEAVQPQVIVLQSDATNRRGDPDSDTLALLPLDIPLFRTDQQGTIHFWTNGRTLHVQPES